MTANTPEFDLATDNNRTLNAWQKDLLRKLSLEDEEVAISEGAGAAECLVETGYAERDTWDPGEGKWAYHYKITPEGQRYLEKEAQIDLAASSVNAELIKYLAKHPEALYDIHPRKFEEIVAAIMEDMGYSVCVTPPTRDGGRDILAVLKLPIGETLTIVDCKRYSALHRIGPDVIQRLLWIADNNDKASRAMIATTSFFTSGARNIECEYKWRLTLSDFDQVSSWLTQYGHWKSDETSGLWVPGR